MKRFVLYLSASFGLMAQTAQYPNSVVTNNELMVVKNQLFTKLKADSLPTDTTIVVASTTGFAANMLVTVDSEIMQVCSVSGSNTLNIGHSSCPNADGRGFDNTIAASHKTNASASVFIDAWHHNAVTAEVKAIEFAVGPLPTNFNVMSYGAKADGVTDDTAAINAAALAASTQAKHGLVVLPPGTYKVTDAIVLTGSVTITGPGAVIVVPPTFNLSAIGVLVLKYAKDTDCDVNSGLCAGAANVSDLTIRFQNTNTGTYGSLVHFPPGIACGDAWGCSWSTIKDVAISQAMIGIKIQPQAGSAVEQGSGVRMMNIKISAFDYGLYLDGSDSEMMLDNYHYYPFDLTPAAGSIWPLHGTGIWASSLYQLNVTNYTASNFYRTLAANYSATKGYCPYIVMSGLVVDTYGGMDINCGNVKISSMTWNTADIAEAQYYVAKVQTSGTLHITSANISHAIVDDAAATFLFENFGLLSVTNSSFSCPGGTSVAASKIAFTDAGGVSTFNGNFILATLAAHDFTGAPFFDVQAGGLMTFEGNRFTPANVGSNGIGLFFDTTGDAAHFVSGNVFGGWGAVYPTTQTLGIYQTDGAQCPTLGHVGTPADGRATCCVDCKNSVDDAVVVGAVCVGSGHGATAVRVNGTWRCY